MDIATYLQHFESSLSSYTGDDLLDPWEKFVEYLEQTVPVESASGMSVVFETLVQRFLHVEQYANDIRYVNYCIKCASYYSEPQTLLSYLYNKGVGTRTTALYVAWAQQFEQRGMNERADAVYQKAVENQAQPADTLQHEYREFQMRTSRNQTAVSAASRTPLQNSDLVNQMSSHREPVAQSKASMDCPSKQPTHKTTVLVSRSENAGVIAPSQRPSIQLVLEYMKDELKCEGSEMCFEEVRAEQYFHKRQEKLERERNGQLERERNEQLEKERLEQLERERIEEERLEQLEKERIEQLERECNGQLEKERLEQLERERNGQLEKERLEQLERECMEQLEKENLEQLEKEHIQGTYAVNLLGTQEEDIFSFLRTLQVETNVSNCPSTRQLPEAEKAFSLNPQITQQSFERPQPSNCLSSRCSLGLTLRSEPTTIQKTRMTLGPPEPQNHTLSSEVSRYASVLPDRSVYLPKQAPHSASTDQTSVVQASVVQPQQLQQPQTALQRHMLCMPGTNDVFLDDRFQPSSYQEHAFTDQDGPDCQPEEKLDVSQGGTANLSHITPNNSLGFAQATPSRVLPSPTVNTREALDVIMDMFQAPTLLEDAFHNASVHQTAENDFDARYPENGEASSFAKLPTTATPFVIFQDNTHKENCSATAAPPAPLKAKPVQALAEIPVSKPDKPNETPELMPDESTMWGARYNSLNSLAACPNSSTDFAMLAQFVSTPSARDAPFFSKSYQDQENCDAEDNAYIKRQSKKLSPIIEHSPSEETFSETAASQLVPSSVRQGTIVGEGLATVQHCLTASSTTIVQPPPPAVLSFRDQTLGPTDSSIHRSPKTTGPGWKVYTSPEQPPQPDSVISQPPESSVKPKSKSFTIPEDLDIETAQEPMFDVPMSPQCTPRMDWLAIGSPEGTAEPDLNAFLSPRQSKTTEAVPHHSMDVPMSPEQQQLCAEVPMSPMQQQQSHFNAVDEPMSPDRSLTRAADVLMNAAEPTSAAVPLVEDPWNDELIAALLSTLTPPLSTHPRCITWQCRIPTIIPKITISMGTASLRVDCILGEGAFATVYQATDPKTSEKIVLKVQKPANPWEFYINTQLEARLQPDVRHLYSNIHSAHFFHNGSVLLGELHNYGTLLNAVNLYKNLSDKVMPQPLVMYFTVCILHMVEQLHAIHIIHADIKPDNFLLGESFLENKCFEPESAEHGLALIDFGQSIDMELFPEGTIFTAKCLTSGFQCTEMLSGEPWNYQTDYFGIAGTVHCMLFGIYMQVLNDNGVWKTNAVFRRNPHSDLWLEFFHTLLNVQHCSSLPSLQSLRRKLTDVLQQNYSSKLPTLKSRLLVLLLESYKSARR
ncbi:hypothetical protein LDENG_00173800 [Lucifuga dentata]|nr:hypothetical protein LDENG_00173800 [Lucifuga dentata]